MPASLLALAFHAPPAKIRHIRSETWVREGVVRFGGHWQGSRVRRATPLAAGYIYGFRDAHRAAPVVGVRRAGPPTFSRSQSPLERLRSSDAASWTRGGGFGSSRGTRV